MCNFFGDPQTVRHKVDVLEQHCQAVGRDPNTIVKTRLGSLIIRDTEAEAQRALQKRLEVPGVNPEWVQRGYLVGDPDRVAEEAQKLLDAGLDGLIFNMPHAEDEHAIELTGQALSHLGAVSAAR
jgi:alkanesulfonate monooxygenase SsuD/methylene tetrahydromethanopterin reductase-like flavin-dependent oxidoreductase (luciferase family)